MTRLYRLMLVTAAVFGVPSAALADGPASGEVTGVSVQASPGRADIVINVRGAVEVRDFMLESPRPAGARRDGRPAEGQHVEPLRRGEARRGAQPPLLPVRAERGPDRSRARPRQGLPRRAGHRRHPGLLWHRPVLPGLVVQRSGPAEPPAPKTSAASPRFSCRPAGSPAPALRSPGSPWSGTAPTSPTWLPASPPSAGARSSWARTSRVK